MNAPSGPRCHDDQVVGLAEGHALLGALQGIGYARRIPLNVTLELTLRCNIRCLHCYNFDRDEPRALSSPLDCGGEKAELSLDEIRALLSDLRAAGCLFLTLTGGEILSHPHLFEVLDRARELNLAVQLLTNGTLLRLGIAKRLASYRNLLGTSVSLYGASAPVHDGITQMPGSWRRTWQGIERLRALGIAVRLKFILMKQNAHEVAAMRADADARAIPYLVDVTITSRHDGTHGSLATRLDASQLDALYRGPLRDLVPRGTGPVTEERFPCNCARGNCAISSTGDVTPCVSVPWTAGNIRERRFVDIWRTSPVFQRIRGLRIADYPSCAPCPDKAFCTRSRGAAFTASGSYTGVDPYVCRTAAITREISEGNVALPPPTASAAVAAGGGR
jgi:radical SAM protein with 4Fe4S-binding SPASM domain